MQLLHYKEMLICLILCSKLVKNKGLFIFTKPNYLSDLVFYESRGT